MADCECLPGCVFFNDKMAKMPSTTDLFKKRYCKGDNINCARYMVFKALGKEKVPPYLYPNMVERAKGVILKG